MMSPEPKVEKTKTKYQEKIPYNSKDAWQSYFSEAFNGVTNQN